MTLYFLVNFFFLLSALVYIYIYILQMPWSKFFLVRGAISPWATVEYFLLVILFALSLPPSFYFHFICACIGMPKQTKRKKKKRSTRRRRGKKQKNAYDMYILFLQKVSRIVGGGMYRYTKRGGALECASVILPASQSFSFSFSGPPPHFVFHFSPSLLLPCYLIYWWWCHIGLGPHLPQTALYLHK